MRNILRHRGLGAPRAQNVSQVFYLKVVCFACVTCRESVTAARGWRRRGSLVHQVAVDEFHAGVDIQGLAATLAQQAQDYPMARSKFDGSTDGLMFSVDGFVFSDASQMDSSMALMGYKTSGQTLHVCHASDLKRALEFSA